MKAIYRPDSIDLEAIKSMVESPGWALFIKRVASLYGERVRDLIHEKDSGEVKFHQGFIEAVSTIQKVPEILADEIRKRQKTNV